MGRGKREKEKLLRVSSPPHDPLRPYSLVNRLIVNHTIARATGDEAGWKWHFRDPKFQNFLGEHAPRPPSLGRLRRSQFPPCAYTFKISRYAPSSVEFRMKI